MDRQLSEWRLGVERIWSAAAPDYREAARLAADIARASEEEILRQAATQALPILRSASADNADPISREAAAPPRCYQRRLAHAWHHAIRQAPDRLEITRARGALPADAWPAARPPPVRAGNPPGLQARRQARASGRRRQRAGISGALRGPRRADEGEVRRHCEERNDEAIHCHHCLGCGLLRGACHRAALCADPLARNDGGASSPISNFKQHRSTNIPSRSRRAIRASFALKSCP
jgi:hypothetical protein